MCVCTCIRVCAHVEIIGQLVPVNYFIPLPLFGVQWSNSGHLAKQWINCFIESLYWSIFTFYMLPILDSFVVVWLFHWFCAASKLILLVDHQPFCFEWVTNGRETPFLPPRWCHCQSIFREYSLFKKKNCLI